MPAHPPRTAPAGALEPSWPSPGRASPPAATPTFLLCRATPPSPPLPPQRPGARRLRPAEPRNPSHGLRKRLSGRRHVVVTSRARLGSGPRSSRGRGRRRCRRRGRLGPATRPGCSSMYHSSSQKRHWTFAGEEQLARLRADANRKFKCKAVANGKVRAPQAALPWILASLRAGGQAGWRAGRAPGWGRCRQTRPRPPCRDREERQPGRWPWWRAEFQCGPRAGHSPCTVSGPTCRRG